MYTLSDFGISRKTARLSNGTKVVLFEKPKAPIYLELIFRAGARYDDFGKEGVAHFVEHMLMAGTKSFPTKDKIAAYIEDFGGVNGAATGTDSQYLWASIGTVDDLPNTLSLLYEEACLPLFEDKTIETERGAIKKELASKLASPNAMLGELDKALIYQGTEVGRMALGSEETISALTKEDLLAFHQKHINADNLLVMVSGGVTMEQLVQLLEDKLKLPNAPKIQFKTDLPIIRDKFISTKHFDGKSLNIALTFRTNITPPHPDHRPMSLMASILGGSRSCSLMKLLRYEKGYVYSISAGSGTGIDGGSFGVDMSISKTNLQVVFEIITKEFNRMKNDGPTTQELQLVKNRLIKSKLRTMQMAGDWVGFHSAREFYYDDNTWTIEDYLKEVEAVTIDDIKRVANTYITDQWYLSATGDVDEDTFKDFSLAN